MSYLAILVAVVGVFTGCQQSGSTLTDVTAQGTQGTQERVLAMKFFKDGAGWALTESALRQRKGRGETAQEVTPARLRNVKESRWSVFFADQDRALAVALSETDGNAVITESRNGGDSWSDTDVPLEYSGEPPSGSSRLYAQGVDTWLLAKIQTSSAGSRAVMYHSSGGEWTKRLAPIFGAMTFTTSSRGWLVGGASGGELYSTRDGGESWKKERTPRRSTAEPWLVTLSAPTFFDEKNGVLPVQVAVSETSDASDLYFYTTNDGGSTWSESQGPLRVTRSAAVFGADVGRFDVIDSQTWLVLADGLWLTRDAGNSWDHVTTDKRVRFATTFDFVDANEGWIYTEDRDCSQPNQDCATTGQLLHTADGGRSWSPDSLA